MAVVTEVTPRRMHNAGDLAVVRAHVNIAATGDTFVHGLRSVEWISCPPRTNLTDVSESNGTITFTTGGAVADVLLAVFGYP